VTMWDLHSNVRPSTGSFPSSVWDRERAQPDSGNYWICEASPTYICHVVGNGEKQISVESRVDISDTS